MAIEVLHNLGNFKVEKEVVFWGQCETKARKRKKAKAIKTFARPRKIGCKTIVKNNCKSNENVLKAWINKEGKDNENNENVVKAWTNKKKWTTKKNKNVTKA
jgi:hypothetical protein